MSENNEIMNFLKTFKTAMEDKIEISDKKNEDNTVQMEAHLGKIDANFEKMKDDIKEIADKNEKENEKLVRRMAKLEEDMRRLHYSKLKSPDREQNIGMTVLPAKVGDPANQQKVTENPTRKSPEKQKQRQEKQDLPTGRKVPSNQPKKQQVKEKETRVQPQYHSSWADEMADELAAAANHCKDGRRGQSSQVDWFDEKTAAEKCVEEKVKKSSKDHLKNWFADEDTELDTGDEDTSDEEQNDKDEDWNKVERREKNKKKKKSKKLKNKKIMNETAMKARDIIGLGPISQSDVERQRVPGKDYEFAKLAAVRRYLKSFLKYNEWELAELDIVSTKMAKDNIIYICVRDHSMIKDLYTRKS